jgi:hypothetical protein
LGRVELQKLAASWDADDYDPLVRLQRGTPLYSGILKEIFFHAEHRFWQFTPSYDDPPFEDRLTSWLQNKGLSPDDLKTLFQLVPHLQFVDRDDMLALYRSAFTGPVARWLIDQTGLDFSMEPLDFQKRFSDAVGSTWFCSITDSMDIAEFHHANKMEGKRQRPNWALLKTFGDKKQIKTYMKTENLKRLVLLEDFVGSGVQSGGPVAFARKLLCPDVPVLFVPLIVSGLRIEKLRERFKEGGGFTFEPLFVIPGHVHLQETPQQHEINLFQELRKVVNATFDKVKLPLPPETEAIAHPFGFKNFGMLVVLHTNCPNNSVPVIWHNAPEWKCLFPRVSRG